VKLRSKGIEFAMREQTRIRADDETAKVEHHAPVETSRRRPVFVSPVGFVNSVTSHRRESLCQFIANLQHCYSDRDFIR
jgi:hypothetical protein